MTPEPQQLPAPKPPRVSSISTPPHSRWQIVREGIADLAIIAATLVAPSTVEGWTADMSFWMLAGVAGLHTALKHLRPGSRGVSGVVFALAGSSLLWSLQKVPWLAGVASAVSRHRG